MSQIVKDHTFVQYHGVMAFVSPGCAICGLPRDQHKITKRPAGKSKKHHRHKHCGTCGCHMDVKEGVWIERHDKWYCWRCAGAAVARLHEWYSKRSKK